MELGQQNDYAVTAAERSKTHTLFTCASASGYALPPMMVYSWKKAVPDHLKEEAVPNIFFRCREAGWFNKDIYLEWFQLLFQTYPQSDQYCFSRMGVHLTFRLNTKLN